MLLSFLNLKCRKSLPCTLSFLQFLSPSPWKSVHFAHLLPLIPNPSVFPCVPAGWPQPNTSPRPFPPPRLSPLSAPRLRPSFLFFFCSVAFNSSRPLCAEWLMAPCWATVRGRKTEAEEEGKTGGDKKTETPEFLADNEVFQCCSNSLNWAPPSEPDPSRHPEQTPTEKEGGGLRRSEKKKWKER